MIGSEGGKAQGIKAREQAIANYYKNPVICKNCNKIIKVKDTDKVSTIKRKEFCNQSCNSIFHNAPRKKPRVIKVKEPKTANSYFAAKLTKKELFDKSKNWQSARSSIRHHAQLVYNESNKDKKCQKCGYTISYHVAHLKSVSSFSEDTPVKTVNDISNLIALCPNHHWEYDHLNTAEG